MLIIMCGFPCSGKSTKARELYEDLKKESEKILLLVDEEVCPDFHRNSTYADPSNEKVLNSLMKYKVTRELAVGKVVIVDALNYVAGVRYELVCLAKSARVPSCIVYCNAPLDDCAEWNKRRLLHLMYSDEVFDALVEKFEVPHFTRRWEQNVVIAFKDQPVPADEIRHLLYGSENFKPKLSTQTQPLSSENFVNMVSKQTKDAVDAIIMAQKGIRSGSPIYISGTPKPIMMNKKRTPAELAQIRRQFLTYAKMRPPSNDNMITLFVQYINKWS